MCYFVVERWLFLDSSLLPMSWPAHTLMATHIRLFLSAHSARCEPLSPFLMAFQTQARLLQLTLKEVCYGVVDFQVCERHTFVLITSEWKQIHEFLSTDLAREPY